MNEAKLLACPFCGSDMKHHSHGSDEDGWYSVGCTDCHTWGPKSNTKKNAYEKWNNRAGDRKPKASKTV